MKTKKQLLRVLFLEENKTTIDQVENVLNDSFHKFSAKTARTEKEFLKYVIRFNPDVIIAGYRLEKYSAGEAFDLLKAENYRIPFFLIADNLSEEVSRALIKSGVEDCLIISNLTTLPISILKILEKNKINLEKDEVENQLKYKEERLQTIFKNTPEAIINLGFKGEILEINPTGLHLLQVDGQKKLSKKDIFDFIHPADIRRFKKFHNSVGIGNSKTEKFRIVGSKKGEYWIESSAVPLFDENKYVVSVLTINRNITEQQKAYSEISFQAQLLENVFDAIISFDNDRRILSWNSAAEKMLGWKSKEAVGMILSELIKTNFLTSTLEEVMRSHDEKGNWSGQLKVTTKHGNELSVAVNSTRFRNEKGETLGIIVSYRDITEQLKDERAVRESEERYLTFFENSMDGILLTAPDGSIVAANPAACRMFKRTEKEICAVGRFGLVDMSDPRVNSLLDERLRTGKARGEITLVRKDGTKFEGEISSTSFTDGNGEIRTSMILSDLSGKKMAEEKALINEKRFQELFENSPDAIYVEDENGFILDVNKVACMLQGYNKDELIGKNLTELTPDKLKPGVSSRFELYFSQQGAILETQIWDRNWIPIPVELKTSRITFNGMPAVLIHARDISKRRKAEKEKRETELKFDVLSDHAPLGIYQVDNEGKFVRTNKKFLEVFELSIDQVRAGEWKERIHPDDLPRFMKQRADTLGAPVEFEIHYKLQIGDKVKYVFGKSNPFYDDEGNVIGRIGTLLDLTENRKTIQQMMFTQTMFQNIFEHSPDPIFIEDLEGNILNANLKGCKMYGLDYSELVGKNIFDFTPANYLDEMKREFKSICDGSTQRINSVSWNKEGKEIQIQKRANLINYFDKVAVLIHVFPKDK